MKRNSYDYDAQMKAKATATKATEADYVRAMKTYKLFAYAAGAVITAVYAISLFF